MSDEYATPSHMGTHPLSYDVRYHILLAQRPEGTLSHCGILAVSQPFLDTPQECSAHVGVITDHDEGFKEYAGRDLTMVFGAGFSHDMS